MHGHRIGYVRVSRFDQNPSTAPHGSASSSSTVQ